MTESNHPHKKGTDEDIQRLNIVGLSLGTIGGKLGCHPTAITLRLKKMNIPAADTRRSFMEDIWANLPPEYMETAAEILLRAPIGEPANIKELVRKTLKQYLDAQMLNTSSD